MNDHSTGQAPRIADAWLRSQPPKRPTILEVARLAGVSHQTVSRFLREDPTVNAAMAARISQAVGQLGYRPNLAARAMRNPRSGRLALLLPAGQANSSLGILTGAGTAAERTGHTVEMITLGGAVSRRGERALELAHSGLYEGVVSLTPLGDLGGPGRTGAPLVVSPTYDDAMRGIGILADASALREIMHGLVRLGHTRFVHLAGDAAHAAARERRSVFETTARALGLQSYSVVECEWDYRRARAAVLELPAADHPTAVVAANDRLAAGAVTGALLRGWRVPDDVSVTGWDDDPLSAAILPALTTVGFDYQALGEFVIGRLLAALGLAAEPAEPTGITTVVWRESTGPAGAAGTRPAANDR